MNKSFKNAQALMRLYFVDKSKIVEAIKGFPRGDMGYHHSAFESKSAKSPLYSVKLESGEQYVPVLTKKRLFEYSRLYSRDSFDGRYKASVERGLSGVRQAVNADLILNQHRIQVASALRNNFSQDLSGETDYLAVTKKLSRLCKGAAPFSCDIIPPILLVAAALVEPSLMDPNKPITWIDYERSCASALRDAGFNIEMTSAGADYGADIVCVKDDRTYAIQCKLYARSVGLKAVQEILAARAHYTADFAVVCSESGFTLAAANLADSNDIYLTNIVGLSEMENVWS